MYQDDRCMIDDLMALDSFNLERDGSNYLSGDGMIKQFWGEDLTRDERVAYIQRYGLPGDYVRVEDVLIILRNHCLID